MQIQSPSELPALRLNIAAYGWLLALSTLLALAIIAHHPMADMHDPAKGLQNVIAVSAMGRWVHGALIVMVLLFTTGFSGFAWRLGISHALVMAGWISYLIGSLAMMTAGLCDGFIIPEIAMRIGGHAADPQAAYDFIAFCGIVIQAQAKLAFVLMALSALFWGHALLHHKGGARWIGVLGIIVGGASAAFILISPMRFDVNRLLAYMSVQAIWYLTVAIWMIRGLRVSRDS